MSQTSEDQNVPATPPTSEEVIGKVNESITALQTAQQTVVEGAKLLGDHVNDVNAHGAGVQANIEAAMPQPVWEGTSLKFQRADGTMVAEATDLKGEPGQDGMDGVPGPAGPRPEHRWDGTSLKIQNADGSWPEAGVELKGEPGELANLSDAVDSDSSITAASSKAVKTAYDKAVAADQKSDVAQTSAGEAKNAAQTALTKAEQALAGGGGSGGGGVVMAAPTISGPEYLAVGRDNTFRLSAVPGLDNTVISSFSVSLTGQANQTVTASGNAADVTFAIPADTSLGTPMTLTAVAVDSLNNRSLPATLAIETSESYVPAPVFVSPAPGRVIDPVNITWELAPFAVSDGADADTHMASRYRIVNEEGAVVYDSGERTASGELTTWTAAAPDVQGGAYRLQTAFKGQALGWSAWGEVSVTISGVKAPRLISPGAGSEISHYYVTFGTSAFTLGSSIATDTHVASQYRIISQDGQTVLYDSGECADLVLHVIIPQLKVELGGTYLFDARHKGKKLGWSDWSAPVSVRIARLEQFTNEVAFTDAGAANFVVPDDITQLRVLVVGGGSGGGGYATQTGGVGGKGGGIASALINVTPGSVIPLSVGRVGMTGAGTTSTTTQQSNGAAGGDSTFGDWITAKGGTNTAHGSCATSLGKSDELICSLSQTLCASYRSYNSFRDMSLNQSSYDTSFGTGHTGGKGSDGSRDGSTGSAGTNGGTGSISGGYGVGGNGGAGGNGGNGGGKGGSGGNGGAGGNGNSGTAICGNGGTGGNGGSGGASLAFGGSGGNGGNGGSGGTYGGCGGNGGNGGNSYSTSGSTGGGGGAGGTAGYGGNGGNGGNGGRSYSGYKNGVSGASGGPGCVVVFF